MNLVRCPKCKKDVSLWQGVEVPGWRSIDREGRVVWGGLDSDVQWETARPDGTYGCSECGWEGRALDHYVLGIDGEELPEQNPNQEAMPV